MSDDYSDSNSKPKPPAVAPHVVPLELPRNYWRYAQASGDLEHIIDGGIVITIVSAGYSGHAEGLNNPDLEHVHSVGPIPRGRWAIGAPHDSDSTGPYSLPLWPDADTDTHGRSQFLMHGDNYLRNRSASHGCIVLPRRIRELVHESSDGALLVIA